jgi:rhodanese-related sulfurtransferase
MCSELESSHSQRWNAVHIIDVLFSEDFEDNLIPVNQVTVIDLNLLKVQ